MRTEKCHHLRSISPSKRFWRAARSNTWTAPPMGEITSNLLSGESLPGVVERRKTSFVVAGLAHAGSLAEQALRHVGSQIQIRTGAVAVFAAAIASEDAGIATGQRPRLCSIRSDYVTPEF